VQFQSRRDVPRELAVVRSSRQRRLDPRLARRASWQSTSVGASPKSLPPRSRRTLRRRSRASAVTCRPGCFDRSPSDAARCRGAQKKGRCRDDICALTDWHRKPAGPRAGSAWLASSSGLTGPAGNQGHIGIGALVPLHRVGDVDPATEMALAASARALRSDKPAKHEWVSAPAGSGAAHENPTPHSWHSRALVLSFSPPAIRLPVARRWRARQGDIGILAQCCAIRGSPRPPTAGVVRLFCAPLRRMALTHGRARCNA
jgi:hypothetical protein